MNKYVNESQLSEMFDHDQGNFAIFLYTPMCGTCKLAERMLDIIMEMQPGVRLYKSNINALSEFVQSWKIQSVPCLLVVSQGDLLYKIYAMNSVDHLYNKLKPIFFHNKRVL